MHPHPATSGSGYVPLQCSRTGTDARPVAEAEDLRFTIESP